MKSRPLVSVVTPTYNRADYLRIAIDSVLAQTYPHFEHLVIDDGSEDSTPRLMDEYGDERVRYFRQENQGQSVARNVGIEQSRGDYICFLDSDNAWVPEKLQQQIEAFESYPDVGVVYGDNIFIDAWGNDLGGRNMLRFSGRITEALLGDNFVSMNTTMSRADVLREAGGFDPADRYAEDYGLWLRVSLHESFLYLPRLWAYYRIMENQISSDKLTRLDANEDLVRSFVEEHAHELDPNELCTAMARFYGRKGRVEANGGRGYGAIRSGLRAVAYAPTRLNAWRSLLRILVDAPRGAAR
ncbi:glycosyltransferase [Aquisalimonas sp. 2447]|uniref:glycosyltransferase n=1 Tax=Aquisalimonas sp. 2447 TaxID=2740807 RepID=UPI0014324B73|nr:glycosyltransferase [Aquisalimonas sp. 2447]QIT56557.1 glycosyltransferase [Aquisalimonas sp. 2447]